MAKEYKRIVFDMGADVQVARRKIKNAIVYYQFLW